MEGEPGPPGRRRRGLIEYLFVVSLIAIVCMVAVTFFGNQNNSSMQKSADTIEGTTQVACPAPGRISERGICEI